MYVNLYASRLATKVAQLPHASGYLSFSTFLYISRYSRKGPASSARYKRRAEGRPGCTILGQSTAVSSGRFIASIPWIPWMSHLVNRAQEGSRVACTRNKE